MTKKKNIYCPIHKYILMAMPIEEGYMSHDCEMCSKKQNKKNWKKIQQGLLKDNK